MYGVETMAHSHTDTKNEADLPLDDVEALNDHLARNYPIDDYYDRSILPIRLIESGRLAIIRDFVGDRSGQPPEPGVEPRY